MKRCNTSPEVTSHTWKRFDKTYFLIKKQLKTGLSKLAVYPSGSQTFLVRRPLKNILLLREAQNTILYRDWRTTCGPRRRLWEPLVYTLKEYVYVNDLQMCFHNSL